MQRKPNERERQRELMATRRAEGRDITIPPVLDQQRREDSCNSLRNFIETYFPAICYSEFSEAHLEIIAALESSILGAGRIAIAAPRGFGKTTLTVLATVWAIAYGHKKYVVVLAKNANESRRVSRLIKGRFEVGSGPFHADFPEICVPVMALDRAVQKGRKQTVGGIFTDIRWGEIDVCFPSISGSASSGSRMAVRGLDGPIRGLLEDQGAGFVRPDIALIDDPQDSESARSHLQIGHRKDLIIKDIFPLAGSEKTLSVVSLWTVIEPNDLADQFTGGAVPGVRPVRFQAVSSWPSAVMPDSTSGLKWYEEYILRRRACADKSVGDYSGRSSHAWYIRHRDQIEDGASVIWESAFDPSPVSDDALQAAQPGPDVEWIADQGEDVQSLYRQLEVSAFQKYMNFIADGGDTGWAAFLSEYQNAPEDPVNSIPQLTRAALLDRFSRTGRCVVPSGCHRITAAIDPGGDAMTRERKGHFYAVTAWGDGMSGTIIDAGRFRYSGSSNDSEEVFFLRALHATIEHVFGQTYTAEGSSVQIGVQMCLVDSGWQTDTVYQAVRESPHARALMASKGVWVDPGKTLVGGHAKTMRQGPEGAWFWGPSPASRLQAMLVRVNVNMMKTFAAERLLATQGMVGSVDLYGNEMTDHRELISHLCSEKRERVETKTGFVQDAWTQSEANEGWDCFVLCCVAEQILGGSLDAARREPRRAGGRKPNMGDDKNERKRANVRKRKAGWGRSMF